MNILVTGGASGLGNAITRKLAAIAGNHVYFTFHTSEEGANALQAEYANTTGIPCNFRDEASVAELKNRILTMDLDMLVNNAYTGEAVKSHFHKLNPAGFLTDFKNNILPTIAITQVAIEGFRKKKSGKIVTLLTAYLLNTPPAGTAIYAANKAYLKQLAKTWATENIKYNIASNTISPSLMLTAMVKDTDERVLAQLEEQHPLKKLLTVDETADAVVFLLNAGPQINGLDIVLNAGSNIA